MKSIYGDKIAPFLYPSADHRLFFPREKHIVRSLVQLSLMKTSETRFVYVYSLTVPLVQGKDDRYRLQKIGSRNGEMN